MRGRYVNDSDAGNFEWARSFITAVTATPTQHTLTTKSVNLDGSPLPGMQATTESSDGISLTIQVMV